MLYRSELSSRATCGGRTRNLRSISSDALPLSQRCPQPSRIDVGIRHGSAARTGRAWKPVPQPPNKYRLRIAACFKAATHLRRIAPWPAPRQPDAAPSTSDLVLSRRTPPLPRASMPGCLGIARCTRCFNSLANAKTKMPPAWSPRAFAFPRKNRGDRSSVAGIGQWIRNLPSYAQRKHELAPRLSSDGVRRLAMRCLCNMVEVDAFDERKNSRSWRRVRTLHPGPRNCKPNFCETDRR